MANGISKYETLWAEASDPLAIEIACIAKGGQWEKKKGGKAGMGTEFHFREGLKLCWPGLIFHKWLDDYIHEYLNNRLIGLMGPASCAKSHDAAIVGLFDYYCFPTCTTGIYCSTTRELLQQRIWGEVVGLHKRAIRLHEWLPGHLIESRMRIVTSDRDEESDGRDFRNGLLGVPCKKGESWVNLADFAGIKNKRVRLFADECSLLPPTFPDVITNLDKNPDFKCSPLANPKDPTDAFGKLCEPSAELGGWEGGIDQQLHSKKWATRRKDGVCLQRIGIESPNLDGKLGIPLLTQEAIDRDISYYTENSVQYTMMDLGIMPRGQGSRRVLTRQEIEMHGAKRAPIWLNTSRTKIASLDAAYRSTGGDRCMLKFGEFGDEMHQPAQNADGSFNMDGFVTQPSSDITRRRIFSITETIVVPIAGNITIGPEDQIATFCMNECVKRGIPPDRFFYDSGMRTSLVQSFSRIWSVNTQSIDCGGKPTDREVSYDIPVKCHDFYSKLISEFWFSVRLLVLAGQFRGMTEGEISEFTGREWGIVGNNKTEVEPKAKCKAKLGKSPDEADCVAIMVEGARRLGFVIRRLRPAVENESDDRWKRELEEKAKKFWSAGQLSYA